MKNIILIFVLMIWISFELLSKDQGSCNFPNAGQCLRFSSVVTDSDRKTSCGQMSEAVYINGLCSNQAITGKCTIGEAGRTADLIFYSPQWTMEAAKIRCVKMKGSFDR